MVEVIGVEKSFGDVSVIRGVDLFIPRGEIVAIAGASGAGKTTLLQIIGTLEKPDKGIVRIDGLEPPFGNDTRLSAFRNKHIGFIFQFHQLLPEFTAHENVMLPAMIAGKSGKEVQERAHQLLEQLGMKHRADHKPSALSGGEQQRVAVARALMNEPKLLLADEPSGNLDSKHAKELHELFFSLRESLGQTIIIVTHNEELARMADRCLTMVDGRISG